MKRSLLLILLSLCTIGIVAFFLASKKQTPGPVAKETPLAFEPQRWTLPDPGRTDSQSYKEMVARLEAQRVALAARYQQTASSAQQAEIMAQARTLVSRSIYTEIFPSWYGTVWDFNGTTEVPQQGKIACGYFVTTVLRDAGWKVQRARLAQQASENIILSLTTDAYIKRFRRVAISDFVNAVKEWGAGIYVVGLDIHTGCTKARFRRAYPDDWPVRGRVVGFFSVQISSARSIGVSEFPVRKRLPAIKATLKRVSSGSNFS